MCRRRSSGRCATLPQCWSSAPGTPTAPGLGWPSAASRCKRSARLAARREAPGDADDGALAANLMAGIVMDTATFAHPNATPRTLLVSAALLDAGAPLCDISRRLDRTEPDAPLRLF